MDSSDLPYLIEPMRLSDVPTVASIEEVVFPTPWAASSFRYEICTNPHSHYLVARLRNGRAKERAATIRAALRRLIGGADLDWNLVGYGGFWLMVDEAHVSTLAVRRNLRRRGIGELLLVSLMDRAVEFNASVATLEVRVSNLAAQALYEKLGFAKVGRRKGYYSDSGEDALIMTAGPLTAAHFQAQFQRSKAALRERLIQQNP